MGRVAGEALFPRARSLREGLEEALTLHRLGLYGLLGRSFKTTNCLELVNSLIDVAPRSIRGSNQRHRWLPTALLDIEPRLRRVKGHRHLSQLRQALRRELELEEKSANREAA